MIPSAPAKPQVRWVETLSSRLTEYARQDDKLVKNVFFNPIIVKNDFAHPVKYR